MSNKLKKIAILNALDSDSDDSDDLELDLLNRLMDGGDEEVVMQVVKPSRKKRNCIMNYLEEVVPSYTDDEFKMHFRINRSLCSALSTKFERHPLYEALQEEKRFTAEKNILIFLWFAGHEACSFRDIGDRFNLSISSVSRIIHRVTMFLSGLCDETFMWPNETKKLEISNHFKNKYGFPKVIGAIDGTHITIDPPTVGKDDYINRKGTVSICLQAISDHQGKFIDVFVGFPGSTHDSRVLKNSFIYPKLDGLCNGYFILGDSAYPCQKSLLTPFRDNGHLTAAQKHYNSKLSSCRVVVEHAFGMLKQRFRQLYYCKLRGMEKLCHFIRACCVLHNLANRSDLNFIEDTEASTSQSNDATTNEDSTIGKSVRDLVCKEITEGNI